MNRAAAAPSARSRRSRGCPPETNLHALVLPRTPRFLVLARRARHSLTLRTLGLSATLVDHRRFTWGGSSSGEQLESKGMAEKENRASSSWSVRFLWVGNTSIAVIVYFALYTKLSGGRCFIHVGREGFELSEEA